MNLPQLEGQVQEHKGYIADQKTAGRIHANISTIGERDEHIWQGSIELRTKIKDLFTGQNLPILKSLTYATPLPHPRKEMNVSLIWATLSTWKLPA